MINAHTFLAKLIHWTFIPLYAYGIFKQVDAGYNKVGMPDPKNIS